MTRILRMTLAAGLMTSAVAACNKAPPVAPEVLQIVQTRHQGYENIGEQMKLIGDTLKAGGALNADLAAAAQIIKTRADEVVGWFPAGSGPETGVKTRARAEIWQQPEQFEQRRVAFVAEAAKLADYASAGDADAFAAQMGDLGATCKACHDDFRAPKK